MLHHLASAVRCDGAALLTEPCTHIHARTHTLPADAAITAQSTLTETQQNAGSCFLHKPEVCLRKCAVIVDVKQREINQARKLTVDSTTFIDEFNANDPVCDTSVVGVGKHIYAANKLPRRLGGGAVAHNRQRSTLLPC